MDSRGSLVAVRHLDKQLYKGWTRDFLPSRRFFHVEPEGVVAPIKIPMQDLKAIFFIKTLGRDPSCVDQRVFQGERQSEKKVWLEFKDGERLAGWSNSFASRREGFYVFPADAESNMEKAYVFRSALRRLEHDAGAEAAARSFLASASPAGPPKSELVGVYRIGPGQLPHGRDDLRRR